MKTVVLKDGRFIPIRDQFGRGFGVKTVDDLAPQTFVTLEAVLDLDRGVVDLTADTPNGGQAVIVGQNFVLTVQDEVTTSFRREDVTSDPVPLQIEVRVSLAPNGTLGPPVVVPLIPAVTTSPVVVAANPVLTSTGRVGDPVAHTRMSFTGGDATRHEVYAEYQVGSGPVTSELGSWAQVPDITIGAEIWARERVWDQTLNAGEGDWVERLSNRVVVLAAGAGAPVPGVDILWDDSAWFPETQTVTFAAAVTFPGMAGTIPDLVEWTGADIASTPLPTHRVALRSGGVYVLRDRNHPVISGFDAGKFTEADERRGSIRFRRRANTSAAWSQWSTVMSEMPMPEGGVTEPPDVFNATVSNRTDLETAIRDLLATAGNQVIGVAGGVYGAFGTEGSPETGIRKSNGTIRIAPQDRANPPIFSGFDFGGTSLANGPMGIILDGLSIIRAPSSTGYGTGQAVVMAFAQGCEIRRCQLDGAFDQINLNRARNCLVRYNLFAQMSMDGIRVYGDIRDIVIEHNRFERPNINTATSQGGPAGTPHPDYIQWGGVLPTVNGALSPAQRLTVRYNSFQTHNHYQQVCYGGSTSINNTNYTSLGFDSFRFIGNYIEGRTLHGITMRHQINAEVRGNVFRDLNTSEANWRGPDSISTITIMGRNSGSIVNNRLWRGIYAGFGDGGTINDFSESGNVVTQDRANFPPTEAYGTGWVGMPAVGPSGWGRQAA